jgi:hypothetical protein
MGMFDTLIAIALASSAATTEIGPEPSMEEFIAVADPVLAAEVRRPEEVKFAWPYRLNAGPIGYYTCGKVSTYEGKRPREEIWVTAVVANGKVVNTQWSTKNGMLAWSCKQNVKKGILVPR